MSALHPRDPSQVTAAPVVLVIDDDEDLRMLIRDAIEEAEARRPGGRANVSVIECGCGEDALAFLEEQVADVESLPALIYIDVEMPGIGGLETVRRIKSDTRWNDIPIVVMSGLSDDATIRRAGENGADAYRVKPNDADALTETVLTSTDYWLFTRSASQEPQA
jgi:CheY-like chemotaxis protein